MQVLACPSTDPACNTLNASPFYCFTSSLISSWKPAHSPGSGLICDQSRLSQQRPPLHPRPRELLIRTFTLAAGRGPDCWSGHCAPTWWVSPFRHLACHVWFQTTPTLFEIRRLLEVTCWAEFTMPSKGAAPNKGRGVLKVRHEIGLKL